MKKSKRIISLFLSLLVLLSTFNVFAVRHPVRDIPLNGIIVNDHIVYSDVYPYIKNSRTYVPIRFIAEELGYDVKWDGANKKVKMTNGSTNVELTIGSNKMIVNGKTLTLDAPAEIKDDRTFVPLRAIAESFGEKVDYSKDYKAVYIGDNPVYNKDYKVVYYYEGANPIITDYTVNIVTYKVIVNSGKFFDCDSMESLLTLLFADFDYYRVNGKSTIGNIKIYKTLNVYSNNNKFSNNQETTSNRVVDDSKYYKISIVNDKSELLAHVFVILKPNTSIPQYIRYLDGTIKFVNSWDEVDAENKRLAEEVLSGKSIKEVSTAKKITSETSNKYYTTNRNNQSNVDYLRSKNTDKTSYTTESYNDEPVYDIAKIVYDSKTQTLKYIEFSDGTRKPVSTIDEIYAEYDRIDREYKKGRPLIDRYQNVRRISDPKN
ncbi:copper amine oxidase N-terminal domain-containing protein [uncultured Peptoniphilus sp.]|uniref:copper amine oxidase N-terminal domain-containing protein n=1 Tax=uncultured Peptoniphilus sp. TaxID=254354 RepID=UPI002616C5CF|nr:copper amine oxidase N-terminal domain-containing protein [uncultured Peptoniphilus sp.]